MTAEGGQRCQKDMETKRKSGEERVAREETATEVSELVAECRQQRRGEEEKQYNNNKKKQQ